MSINDHLKQAEERARDADADWHACMDRFREAEAQLQRLREAGDELARCAEYACETGTQASIGDFYESLATYRSTTEGEGEG